MSKSLELFKYFVMLTPEAHPVVELYALSAKGNAKVTKYDVYHLLFILKRSHLISRNKHKGGLFIPLPQLFFNLSYAYAQAQSSNPKSFIKTWLAQKNISWCYNDLMNFIKNYGDTISLFFAVVDAIFSRSELSFRAATLLCISTDVMPKPYSYIIPDIESSLIERIELGRKALSKIYSRIKDRISSLVSDYSNPVYINARNIATAILFYVLLCEGVRRVLFYEEIVRYQDKDPHLKLLFSLNKEFIDYFNNWEEHLISE